MSVFTQRVEGANVDAVKVDGSAVIQPVSGTVAVSNPGLTDAQLRATPVPVSGTVTANLGTVDGLALDATLTNGTQHTIVDNFPATQPVSGTLTVNQGTSPWVVSGTITTSPNVNVHDGAGNTIASTGTSLNVDVTNTVPVTGTFWQAVQPVSGTFWQATQPISGSVSVSNFPADADALAQGSTTSGQLGALVMGAVTTAAPTYTTATTNPLSIDTAGNLRVVMSNSANNNKASTATITRVATSTTAVTLLAANANRKKLVIRTETGADNYIAFGSTASATNYTYDLGLNATLEDTVWTGSVSLIRASGSGSVQVTELV